MNKLLNNIKDFIKLTLLIVTIISTIFFWIVRYEKRISELEDNLMYITMDFVLFYRNYLLKNKILLDKEIYELMNKKELTEIEKKHLYDLIYQKEMIEKELKKYEPFISLYLNKYFKNNNLYNSYNFNENFNK